MDILWNLLSLLAPLALGYFLKRKRFFGPRDYQLLAKIALNITLPAAVICSFADFTLDYSLLSLILLAFLANWATLLFTWATTVHDRENVRLRSMKMLCAAGYNLGNFLIPFVQQMLGGPGLALASLFDSGNSLMSVGGSFVFTSSVVKASGAKPLKVKDVLLALLRSVTIPIYLTLVVLALFGIRPPAALVTIAEPTGNANAFLSMFMIGLMFEIHFDRNYMGTALAVLGRKYLCGAVFALIFYFLLPFEEIVRQVMVMCVFAPVPSISSVFVGRLNGDVGLASFITSLSFIVSCVILVGLMVVF